MPVGYLNPYPWQKLNDSVYYPRNRVLGTVLLPPLIKIPQLFANLNKNHYICTMTIAKPIINIE